MSEVPMSFALQQENSSKWKSSIVCSVITIPFSDLELLMLTHNIDQDINEYVNSAELIAGNGTDNQVSVIVTSQGTIWYCTINLLRKELTEVVVRLHMTYQIIMHKHQWEDERQSSQHGWSMAICA